MLVLIGFAFLAGIVTVLSPCILPVLPIVLSGSLTGGKKRPFGIITGFVLSFTFFTLFSFALFKAFGLSSETLRLIAVVVLALFGVSLFIPAIQEWMERFMAKLGNTGPKTTGENTGFGGGVVIGLSLGLFWTPCVGPILASVITLAATSAVTFEAVLITLAYTIGTAIPMFAIIYGGRQLLYKIPWVTRHTDAIRKVFGIIMVLLALALYFNLDRSFQKFILDKFPQYGSGLTKFEEHDDITKELQRLQGSQTSEQETSSPGNEEFLLAPNPEFSGATKWVNSEPLTLEKLHGKVVLIDFWTYSCINCIRTLPYVTSWYDTYKDQGLVVIGVHTPEFEFEKKESNVLAAMEDYKIHYPVVQDNDYNIWRSYKNRFWPAEYFIDKEGKVRRTHFGEGQYKESEEFIRKLLAETGSELSPELVSGADMTPEYPRSPESYLGYGRAERLESTPQIVRDKTTEYVLPKILSPDHLGFAGSWQIGEEYAMPQEGAKLGFHFQAKEVYLVMRSTEPGKTAHVLLDGQKITAAQSGADVKDGVVTLDGDRLYRLVTLEKPEDHTLTLEFPEAGVEVYAFTFG